MKSFDLGRKVGAVVVAAGLAFAAAPALAQGVPAAPAAPAPTPAAQPALSPSHLALAVEVVRMSGMSRSIDVMVPETVSRARIALTQMHPNLGAELEKSIAALKIEFGILSDEAVKVAAKAFGSRLSEAELGELKKFYSSDIGRKFVAAQPAIIEEMYRGLDEFATSMSQIVLDKIREDMKKKGHNL